MNKSVKYIKDVFGKALIETGIMLTVLKSPIIFNLIGLSISPHINKTEFYQVTKEEKELIESRKNNTKIKNIEFTINDTIKTSYCYRTDTITNNEEGHNYAICMKTSQLSRFVIRHELYHIYNGHIEYSYLKKRELQKLNKEVPVKSLEILLKKIDRALTVGYRNEIKASAYALFGEKYSKTD